MSIGFVANSARTVTVCLLQLPYADQFSQLSTREKSWPATFFSKTNGRIASPVAHEAIDSDSVLTIVDLRKTLPEVHQLR